MPGEPDLSPGCLMQEALGYQIGGRESWEPRTTVQPLIFQEGTKAGGRSLAWFSGLGRVSLESQPQLPLMRNWTRGLQILAF